MEPIRVAVVDGGASGEREISLLTGAAIRHALGALGHLVQHVEIEASGQAWRVDGQVAASPAQAMAQSLMNVDCFFLALHGGQGENGSLQGFFEICAAVYTGSPVDASALCMDKLACLRVVEQEGLTGAPRLVASKSDPNLDEQLTAAWALGQSAGGLAIKPICGGSSVATQVLFADETTPLTQTAVNAAVKAVFATNDRALIEARIEGIEVTCAILDDPAGNPQALPVVEIRPKSGRFFDFQEKYSNAGALELCPAESLSTTQLAEVKAAALKAHTSTGCRGYSRVDFMLDPKQGLVFLEINTLPGMTARSLLPQAAAEAGLNFGALCERILQAALKPAIPCESLAQEPCK